MDSSLQSTEELPLQIFEDEEHSSKSFFQVLEIYWDQFLKSLETLKTLIHQNFIGFKPLKSRKISTTIL